MSGVARRRIVDPKGRRIGTLRDAVYDPRAQQAAMAVTVHYEDGGVCESMLVLTPAQVELYYNQLGHMIKARESAQDRRR